MKKQKYSVYLRQDQVQFLRNLDNASSFVREGIDLLVAKSDRTQAEKTIVLYEAIQELEDKITAQKVLIKSNGEKTEKIEEAIEEAQIFLKTAQKIANGYFQVQQHKGKFRVLYEREDDKFLLVSEGDTEEEAKTTATEKGKSAVEVWKSNLKEAKQKKKAHQTYMDVQKAKLKDREKNLKMLEASMK